MAWAKIVGKRWTLDEFETYVKNLKIPNGTFKPSSVTLHHTWRPTLEQWKRKNWNNSLLSLESFYKGKGWNSGPHLYIDDQYIYGFTPLWIKGVHAISFNHDSWGIEMVGDFGGLPNEGNPVPQVQFDLVVKTLICLYRKLGVIPTDKTLRFHRDDPEAHKTCPGLLVNKSDFVSAVFNKNYASTPSVVVNLNKLLNKSIQSILVDGTIYVETRPFMEAIVGQVIFDAGKLTVVRKGTRLYFAPGTYKTVNGHSYLPLNELVKKFGLTIDEKNRKTTVFLGD